MNVCWIGKSVNFGFVRFSKNSLLHPRPLSWVTSSNPTWCLASSSLLTNFSKYSKSIGFWGTGARSNGLSFPKAAAASIVSLSVDRDLKWDSAVKRLDGAEGLDPDGGNPCKVSRLLGREDVPFAGFCRRRREIADPELAISWSVGRRRWVSLRRWRRPE